KVKMDGTGYSVLRNFTNFTYVSDGTGPYSGVTLSGSVLYGTTFGTVFKLNTDGTGYTVLTNLDNVSYGDLTLSGSVLYGTTQSGGSTSYGGTVFKVNTDGTGYTELYNFTGGSDGAYPYAGVTLSSNVLYGTAHDRGSSGSGVVFRLNTDGTGFTVLKSFS